MRHLLPVIVAATLAACAQQPRRAPIDLPAYVAADHSSYKMKGNSALTGQAFLRQRGGTVVTCAGSTVTLVPASPYFRALVAAIMAGERQDLHVGMDPDVARTTSCDAQGNFSFRDVPAGSWIVATRVTWQAGRYGEQGGNLFREAVLEPNQQTTAILSGVDQVVR